MFHVCFCFTDTSGLYYQHPLVALTSIFANTKSTICAHVFCDKTVSASSQKSFVDLAERYGQEVYFYSVPSIPQAVLDNVQACFGKGSLFRLFIQELLQEERVLYLDCDVICNLDIQEIFAWDIGSLPVAGVLDIGLRDDHENAVYTSNIGVDPIRYINSGVMLMNLRKMREDCPDYKEVIFTALIGKKYRYPDQDAINGYFQRKGYNIGILPEKYNYVTGISDRAFLDLSEYEGKLLHFTRGKPWEALYPAALLYWKYYSYAFSCEVAFHAMEKLAKHEHAYLYNFILQKPFARRMLKRFWDVSRQGLAVAALDRIFPVRRKGLRATRNI